MTFPKRQAAIVGVYLTEQARQLPGKTSIQLELEALKGALADAGLKPEDVDGIVGRRISDMGNDGAMFWAEQLGRRPLGLTDSGFASGSIAKAALAIAAGMCEVVVYIHGNAGRRLSPGGTPMPTKAPRVSEWDHGLLWGSYMSTWYAFWAQRYMHEFGVTSEQLAEVAVAMRYHATLNPRSIMGSRGRITVDDVVNSRMVASPLHLLDCCIDNDGGYGLVITTAERAANLKQKPVYILGGAEAAYIDGYINIDKPWFTEEGKAVRRAADRAFEMAGVSRDDIDVAGLYDCFTITVFRDLEEMGFCKLGEAADFVQGGALLLGGRLPTNPDGGLMSHSHNGNPGGMHTIEVVRQLRGGDVEPDRQVKDAKIGISLTQGMAVHGRCGVLIMAAD